MPWALVLFFAICVLSNYGINGSDIQTRFCGSALYARLLIQNRFFNRAQYDSPKKYAPQRKFRIHAGKPGNFSTRPCSSLHSTWGNFFPLVRYYLSSRNSVRDLEILKTDNFAATQAKRDILQTSCLLQFRKPTNNARGLGEAFEWYGEYRKFIFQSGQSRIYNLTKQLALPL